MVVFLLKTAQKFKIGEEISKAARDSLLFIE
jgi:hypothetical protein